MTLSVYDFAVVGAGIGGVSIAYELAATGATVILLEQEHAPAFHTTGRSAAMYARGYGNHAVRALTTASSDFYFSPQAGFDRAPMIGPSTGCLFVARQDQIAALDAHEAQLRRDVPDVERLSAREALQMVSILDPDYVAGAVYEPHSANLDVSEIHGNYLRQAKQAGVVLDVNAGLTAASHQGQSGWTLTTTVATLVAGKIVNAAGAWADDVASLCGIAPVGIQPMRRTAMIIDGPANVEFGAWPLLLDVEDEFYFKPEAGAILASPCDETPMPPHDAAPDEMDIAVCADRIMTATSLQISRINHKWAGLRSFAPDRSPVIGPDPQNPDFVWMAGQGGYGIQMGPALARACAGLVTNRQVPDDIIACGLNPDDILPDRFRV